MEWFYASGTDQKGPIEQVEFDRLVQGGVITPSTLVWREGMTDWKPYGDVAVTSASNPSMELGKGEVVCSECGKPFGRDETVRLGSGFVCASCKPVAMQKLREGATNSTSEQIRQEHIKHEASVKSIGLLYFLSAGFLILSGTIAVTSARGVAESVAAALVLLAFAAGFITVGIGLSRLKPWARIAGAIFSGLSLFICTPVALLARGAGGVAFGAIINAYALYLLLSRKGKTVFSDGYKQVIQDTPHIKYRTSILVWIVGGLVLLILLMGVLGMFVAMRRPH